MLNSLGWLRKISVGMVPTKMLATRGELDPIKQPMVV